MGRQYAVFGLGNFGKSVALSLERLGCEVLVVDKSMEKIQEISDEVSYAMRADIEEAEVMETIGARNLDGEVIALSENLEASIVATIMAKETGIPYVIAKAQTELQGRILKKVGADVIVYPEKEMGIRIARGIVATNFAEWIDLSPEYSLVEWKIPAKWAGKTLLELRIRERKGINVVGIIQGSNVNLSFEPTEPLPEDGIIILIGSNKVLQKLKEE